MPLAIVNCLTPVHAFFKFSHIFPILFIFWTYRQPRSTIFESLDTFPNAHTIFEYCTHANFHGSFVEAYTHFPSLSILSHLSTYYQSFFEFYHIFFDTFLVILNCLTPVHAFYKSSYALCFGSFMYFESSPFGHTFSYSQPFRILGHISECPHPFFESLHTFQLLLLSPTLLFPIVFEFYCVFFDTSETFLAASNCLIRFYTHFKSSYVFQIFTFFQVLIFGCAFHLLSTPF